MRASTALICYRLLLPLVFIAAFPGWVLKMLRRGGFGTGLAERLAIYRRAHSDEPHGAVHIHAISVGEALLALKLIRAWRCRQPDQPFVLATGTATGHHVATAAALAGVRVCYAPLDFASMVRRYLNRFAPSQVVLIEGEIWPLLLRACHQRAIAVTVVNARMSPRSARRFRRFAPWLRPVFGLLDGVAIQEPEDAEIWQHLGVAPQRIHHTGSLKFDPGGGATPTHRPEFQRILDHLGNHPARILAASTHAGEEAWIAGAIREAAPDALPIIVPRHAERRAEVKAELAKAGFDGVLRSQWEQPRGGHRPIALVVDSTGELRDWTAHADVVIIGKSFLATGGQNPTEAIVAGKPLICGPHMENFEPLASRLSTAHGCLRAASHEELVAAIRSALDALTATALSRAAAKLLDAHQGATKRILTLLGGGQK